MPTNDFEMDKMEANFRRVINETTAANRRAQELFQREQAAIEYMKLWRNEMRREKAWDRLYMAAVVVCLMCGLFCSYRIGIIPLSITVPVEIACFGLAFGCVVDAVRLFRGGKRK